MRIYVRGPSLGPIHTVLWSSKPRRRKARPTAKAVAAQRSAQRSAMAAQQAAIDARLRLLASLPTWPDQVDAKPGLLRKSHQASLTVDVDDTSVNMVNIVCPHKHSSVAAATACGEAMSALVYASLQGHDAPREHYFACGTRSHRHHTHSEAYLCSIDYL